MPMTHCYNIAADQIIKFMLHHTLIQNNSRGEWQSLCTKPNETDAIWSTVSIYTDIWHMHTNIHLVQSITDTS